MREDSKSDNLSMFEQVMLVAALGGSSWEKGLDFHLFSRAALFRLVARLAGVSLVVQQRPAYLILLAVPYFGGGGGLRRTYFRKLWFSMINSCSELSSTLASEVVYGIPGNAKEQEFTFFNEGSCPAAPLCGSLG